MNKFFVLFFAVLSIGISFSCNDDKDSYSPFLRISEADTLQNFTFEGGVKLVSIETNTVYEASSNADWCQVSVDKETTSLKIETTENTTGDAREAVITIKSQDLKDVTIKVKQSAVGDPSNVDGYPRFAVISDIHLGRNSGGGTAIEKVTKALEIIKAKGELDAVFVVGDVTQNGKASEYDDAIAVFKNVIPDHKVIWMMGNHDWWTPSDENSVANYSKLGQDLHQYFVIKGYPFITLSVISDGKSGKMYYDSTVEAFLKEKLEKASQDFPDKPIFLMYHLPLKNTIYGSVYWGEATLGPILEQYPQIIAFSGHSHYPIGDPRSIHQDKFTSINDGSIAYSELDPGEVTDGIHPSGYELVREGLIVEVNKDTRNVEVNRVDMNRNVPIEPIWTIRYPHTTANFDYKVKYADPKQGPTFASDAKITISDLSDASAKITFPAASPLNQTMVVHSYKIQILNNSGTVIKEETIYSQFYLNYEMPKSYSRVFSNLTPGTQYQARVTALDSYANESTPLTIDFTTTIYIPDPSVKAPVADLFDINFSTGTAKDFSINNYSLISSKVDNPTNGIEPTVAYSNEVKAYLASFVGNKYNYYKLDYTNLQPIKTALPEAFSLETYFKGTNIKTQKEIAPLCALVSGGTGFDSENGTMKFWIRLGNTSESISLGELDPNLYYHMVATYDNATGKISVYLNGSLVASETKTAAFAFPTSANAYWFGVGGSSSPTVGESRYPLEGDVVFGRLYSKAISHDEVANLWQQVVNRKALDNVDKVHSELTRLKAKSSTSAIAAKIEEGEKLMANFGTTQLAIDAFISSASTL